MFGWYRNPLLYHSFKGHSFGPVTSVMLLRNLLCVRNVMQIGFFVVDGVNREAKQNKPAWTKDVLNC